MLRGFLGRSLLFAAADTGAGTGGGTATPGQTGGEPGKDAQGQAESGGQPAAQSGADKPERTFSQADLDRIIKDRLAEEQQRAEKRTAAERKKAEDEALAKNAEWQKLAEARGTELEQYKSRAEAAEVYAGRLNAMIDSEIKAWPAEVTALDPGKDRLEARLEWLEKSRALAAKLGTLPKAPATEAGKGNRPAPAQAGKEQQSGQPTKYRFQSDSDVKW